MTPAISAAGSHEQPEKAYGWAARDFSGILSPFHFQRRANGEKDITINVFYCGICYSDLFFAKDKAKMTPYPFVPGHEIVGEVTKVGSQVRKFKVGDKAGIGCFVGSCRKCENCAHDLENYCPESIWTIAGVDKDGQKSYGGFSDKIVVDEHFAVTIPDGVSLPGAAPLLCAGITVYSPMKFYGLCESGLHIGVVGLGGLGHLAVKFGKAFGMKVTVISTSPNKKKDAMEILGADAFLVSHDQENMETAGSSMDGIIDTVSAAHSILPLLDLMKLNGKLILLGGIIDPLEISCLPLIQGRKVIGGSSAGGLKETQEMVEFSAEHGISADVEVITPEYLNTAMERLEKGDVKYRFVLDVVNAVKACVEVRGKAKQIKKL